VTSSHGKPDDLLTARQIADEYGLDPRVAESIVRNLGRKGKLVDTPIRRRIVRRCDAFPAESQSSGGTT
jgi:ribosomal protein S25